ncbi:hypothetical protein BU25DRAFT_21952 [Macroventuria anomochaeta]|uniref:Uncharacterized protein n=1 Tax=Macroventuria anomochaeta TaxID=301207 RepID=A0ACB6S7G2_9PLEO|nr:uncharacterized protein BU25DRAFT_21952 [Macroventuria anomochaeta]KAF2629442.1 hypothetical protein BU25DRAFT_21952 [Macroventuria anomochaeta]
MHSNHTTRRLPCGNSKLNIHNVRQPLLCIWIDADLDPDDELLSERGTYNQSKAATSSITTNRPWTEISCPSNALPAWQPLKRRMPRIMPLRRLGIWSSRSTSSARTLAEGLTRKPLQHLLMKQLAPPTTLSCFSARLKSSSVWPISLQPT